LTPKASPETTSAAAQGYLATTLGPLSLKNPLLAASGCFGYGEEAAAFVDPGAYGAIIGKSISVLPRRGNPIPRMCETASGMLNSIGLQNPGIDAFIESYLPRMRKYDTVLVVNLVGDTIDEYVSMAERLQSEPGVGALELNISCPNCPVGGMEFGVSPQATELLVRKVRDVFRGPIIAKLTPNVTDIMPICRAAEAGGADALAVANTFVGMAIDWRRRRPKLGGVTGGLSGPAIKPLALRLVWLAASAASLPVIGVGGIQDAEDVLEFLVAGASAVQLGTLHFVDPRAVLKILADLERLAREAGVSRIRDVVGTLKTERKAITILGDG